MKRAVWVFSHYCNKSPQHNGSQKHKFILLLFRRSSIWPRFHWTKIKVLAAQCFSLEALVENLFPCLFQLPELPSSSVFKPSYVRRTLSHSTSPWPCFLHHIFLCLSFSLSLPFKSLVTHWTYQDNSGYSVTFKDSRLATLIHQQPLCHVI